MQHYHRRPLCYLSICPPLFLVNHSVLSCCVIRLKFIYAPFVLTVNSLSLLPFFSAFLKHDHLQINIGYLSPIIVLMLDSRPSGGPFSSPRYGSCNTRMHVEARLKPSAHREAACLHQYETSGGWHGLTALILKLYALPSLIFCLPPCILNQANGAAGGYSSSHQVTRPSQDTRSPHTLTPKCHLGSLINVMCMFGDWRTWRKPTQILREHANLLWADNDSQAQPSEKVKRCETV